MPIIKQVIKGRQVGSLDITASTADITALLALLEGTVTVFDEKSTGGSVATYPAELNQKRFSCGDRTTKVSTSFKIPHAKATAFTPDFEAVVIGAFDASPESSVKCDYMNLLYDRN